MMTTTEMRKTVCTKAAELITKYGYTRREAFTYAWKKVKKEARQIKAADLKEGDVVSFEFGDDNHFVTATVLSVEPRNYGLLIHIQYNDGRIFKIGAGEKDTFEKAA